ncbi:hypothetical protein R1flu_011989 [Riccia fluitans]|uniref:Uncharacterized protein n=1 Tax=Riccia fluitans TaxID=41844 RepID=A0ABD1ZDH4_9MARC
MLKWLLPDVRYLLCSSVNGVELRRRRSRGAWNVDGKCTIGEQNLKINEYQLTGVMLPVLAPLLYCAVVFAGCALYYKYNCRRRKREVVFSEREEEEADRKPSKRLRTMSGLRGLESSCGLTGGSEEPTENLYENGLGLSSPSLLSMTETTRTYSPIGVYPPPVNSPSRFPPPPNSGFSQTFPLNMTPSEGPSWLHHSSHASPDRVAPYDHWAESGVGSVSGCGLDSGSRFMSHWPSPSGNYMDYKKFASTATEPSHPTITSSNQYSLSDARSLVSGFPSTVVNQSTVSPSTTVPSSSCASTHLFSSASTQTTRPHLSNRFSFNPHASAFYPGMYSQTPDGPSEDFSLYCEPSFISQLAPTDFLFTPHQGVDSFHDASSRPVHSPETAPRPISSTARSLFPGLHSPAASSNPSVAPPLSSRTDYCGLSSSSDGSGTREFSCDFPPVSSLSFKIPSGGASIFRPYDTSPTAPPHSEMESAETEEDEMMEQAVLKAVTLLYRQTISPEEWRWNVYETQNESPNAEGLVDFADCISGDSFSTYNYFQGVKRIGPSCMNEVVNGNSNSFFSLGIPERPRIQNQGGPSLKLAASALAEMLATTSTGRSMIDHVSPSPPNASSFHADMGLHVVDDPIEALHLPWLEEKALDDCCSSSGSVAVVKEANGMVKPEESYLYDSNHRQPIEIKKRSMGLANPDASGHSHNSVAAWHPANLFFNTVPEVATTHGCRKFDNEGSGSTLQKASAPSTIPILENIPSDNPNPLFTQIVDDYPYTDSGITRRLTTQSVDAVSSGDDDSVSGGSRANVAAIGSSVAGRCHDVFNRQVEPQVPLRPAQNFGSPGGSSLTAVSPPLSHPPADPPAITTADEVAAKLLASFSLLGPRTLDTMGTAPSHQTVFQSITTSISNLTKVLLATHSSSFTQLDIAPVQESLQGSILGLSQCLLLEQAKVDGERERVASNSVGRSGLNDLTGYEQFAADVSVDKSEAKWPGEGQDKGDPRHMKSSIGSRAEESRSPSNSTGSEISGMTASDNKTPLQRASTENIPVWRESLDSTSKHFHLPGEAKSALGDFITGSDQTNLCQLQDGEIINVVDFLRKRDLINLPALKKFLAAEEREKELMAHIQDLQEQLEFQEERRGTAYLCEAIMQESDLRTSELREQSISAPRKRAGESAGTTDGIADHLQCDDGHHERSRCHLERDNAGNSTVGGLTGEVSDQDIDSAEVGHRSFDVEHPNMEQMEARLAILLGRHSRDNGEVAPDETGCSSPDLNIVKEGLNDSPSLGLHDEDMVKEGAPSGLASHMLKQSEILYNIDAAWNQSYDFVRSQRQSVDSGKFVNQESQCHSATQPCGSSVSIDERAEISRSRFSSSENDMGKDSSEVYAGGADYKSLLGAYDISGLSHSQDSWLDNLLGRSDITLEDLVHSNDGHRQQRVGRDTFGSVETEGPDCRVPQLSGSGFSATQETWLDNIIGVSDVALQDLVHSHNSHRQHDTSRNSSPSPETKDPYDLPHLSEAVGSDKDAVKSVTPSQDSEEESGWEHVRLPRQMAK